MRRLYKILSLCHNKYMRHKLVHLIVLILSLMAVSSCTPRQKIVAENKFTPAYDAYYNYMLGYDAYISRRWDDAIKYYRKALEYDSESTYLKIQLGYALIRKGNTAGALEIAEELLRKNPDDRDALILAGEGYRALDRLEDAIKAYKRITEIDPDNQNALFFLGTLYYYNHELDRAVETMEDLLGRNPSDFITLDYLITII